MDAIRLRLMNALHAGRIHAEKPKALGAAGARRGRPPKAQNIMCKDLGAPAHMPGVTGVDPKVPSW